MPRPMLAQPSRPSLPWHSRRIRKKSACSFFEGKPQFSYGIAALGSRRASIITSRLIWSAAACKGAAPVWGQASRSLPAPRAHHKSSPQAHNKLTPSSTAASATDRLSENSYKEAHGKTKGEFNVWHVKLCCISTLSHICTK